MFEFDIEEFKEGFTGISISYKLGAIEEKFEELDNLQQEIDMVINQLEDIKSDVRIEQEKLVWQEIAKDSNLLIQNNPKITIDIQNQVFIIEAFHGKVFVWAETIDGDLWSIKISMEIVANTDKYHETLDYIANTLNYTYYEEEFLIRKTVKEKKVKETMMNIISKICDMSK